MYVSGSCLLVLTANSFSEHPQLTYNIWYRTHNIVAFTGCIPSPGGARDHLFSVADLKHGTLDLPSKFNVYIDTPVGAQKPFAAHIYDQGLITSCVCNAFSSAYACFLVSIYGAAKRPLPVGLLGSDRLKRYKVTDTLVALQNPFSFKSHNHVYKVGTCCEAQGCQT